MNISIMTQYREMHFKDIYRRSGPWICSRTFTTGCAIVLGCGGMALTQQIIPTTQGSFAETLQEVGTTSILH